MGGVALTERLTDLFAALSDTRLAEEVQLTKVDAGYTFFWIGKRKDVKLVLAPRRPQERKHAKRLDVGKLTNPDFKQELINKLDSEIKTLHMNKDVENSWNKLRDSVYSLAGSVLSQPKHKHHDWFDENNVQIEQL
ncbi:Craniofacial development protein 2 [Biomphalaria glabrata]|nr:Craniofacial development protein 2 [Biomphalaria glabrata]